MQLIPPDDAIFLLQKFWEVESSWYQGQQQNCKCMICCFFIFLFFYFYTLLSLSENLGRLTWVIAAARPALPSPTMHAGSFHVSVIHQTDIDYRILNVHTWSFICVRIHMGVGHTDNESVKHFWLGKTLTNFSCAPGGAGIRTSSFWISSLMLYQLSHPVTPPSDADVEKVQIHFC